MQFALEYTFYYTQATFTCHQYANHVVMITF